MKITYKKLDIQTVLRLLSEDLEHKFYTWTPKVPVEVMQLDFDAWGDGTYPFLVQESNGARGWAEDIYALEVEFDECPSPYGWHNPGEFTPWNVTQAAWKRWGRGVDLEKVRLLCPDEIGARGEAIPDIVKVDAHNIKIAWAGNSACMTYMTRVPYGELPPIDECHIPKCAPYGFSKETGERITCPEGYRLAEPGEDFANNPVEAIVHYDNKRMAPVTYSQFLGSVRPRTKAHGFQDTKHIAVFVKLPEEKKPSISDCQVVARDIYRQKAPCEILELSEEAFSGPGDLTPYLFWSLEGLPDFCMFSIRSRIDPKEQYLLDSNEVLMRNGLAWKTKFSALDDPPTFQSWEELRRNYLLYNPRNGTWGPFGKSINHKD